MKIFINIYSDEKDEELVLDNELNNLNFVNLRIGEKEYTVPLHDLLVALGSLSSIKNRFDSLEDY